MRPMTTQLESGRGALHPAVRVGLTLIALAVGGAFALDTWERGWTAPAVAANVVALLGAGSAALGRATRRPSLERAAPFVAVAALVVAVVAMLVFRVRQ